MRRLAPLPTLLLLTGCMGADHKQADACFPSLTQGHAKGVLGLASGPHGHGASLFSAACPGEALMVEFSGADKARFADRNGMFRVDTPVAAMNYRQLTVTLADGAQLVPAPDVSDDVMVNQIEPWDAVQ